MLGCVRERRNQYFPIFLERPAHFSSEPLQRALLWDLNGTSMGPQWDLNGTYNGTYDATYKFTENGRVQALENFN